MASGSREKLVQVEAVGSHTSKCRCPRNKWPWELYAKLPVFTLVTQQPELLLACSVCLFETGHHVAQVGLS